MIKVWHVAVVVALIVAFAPSRRWRLSLIAALTLALFFVVPG